MSISATSGLSRSTSARPSSRGPGRAQHLDAVATEQQFETLTEGLVIFDQHEAKRHVNMRTFRRWLKVTAPPAL